MVEYNETCRDNSIDSTGPQMSELVPADGSLSRPSHRPAPSNPNVFSDDYSINSIDAPLFSDHRTHSFSSCDSVSTIEARNNNVPPAMVGNVSRANLLEQQTDRQSLASIDQHDEPLTLGRTTTNHTEDDAIDDEETELDPFADQPSSSLIGDDRPSSIRKGITALNRQSTISTTTSTRSGYTAVPRAMSPYRGATGPSHPYAMYPQVGVARTPSMATVSTIRRGDSPMRGRNAPQHPYGMYRQNIDYEEDLGDQPIPVGFPSRGTQPQGSSAQADEVGDIVGPDGHLEQLPPYSRYPDGIIRPTSGRGPASVASEMRERWERYQDEPRSRSNLSTGTLINADTSEPLRPEPSLRTQSPPSDRSSTLVASASLDEKLRRKRERKCCGAPIWLVVTLTMAMITCALVGGVIGGVLGERAAIHRAHLAHQSHSADVVTVTYTSDVSPYTATPTGFGALPTGNYQIPWTITNVSKFCVGTAFQMQSWSCQVAQPLAIDIQGSSYLSSSITVKQPQIENGQINYGAQPPYDITPARQTLYVMIDKEDPELGPALFFQTFFNKLVIVPDSPLMQPPSKRSLSERELSAAAKYEELDAMTDSMKPWFCWWNQTQIETFIYINQTRDGLSPTAKTTTTTTKTTAASITSHTSTATPTAGSSGIRNYPRKIKIKENRVNPNAPTAYCQQMQVHSDHSITPIPGRRIEINETMTRSSNWSGSIPCHCEWLT